MAGSKSTNVKPLFDVLANAGFAWFSIDYRMKQPEFRFPQANDDMNSAIRWVKANVRRIPPECLGRSLSSGNRPVDFW